MHMFASQTMGSVIKYILCLSMLIIKLSLIHGYDSETNLMKIEDLDKQLKIVIKELHEEKEKSVNLEKQLSALKDESKGTPFNYKDQKKEFETVPTYSKRRLFIAFRDEKRQRKRFENEMKNNLKDQREHMENKISTLKDFCSSHIDTKLKTFKDNLLHSVTAPIDKAVNNLRLESEHQKTTLLRHDTMLVSLNDSLVDVQSSIVELNNSCHDKGWSGWSSWGTCSKSCGIGLQTTTRTCRSTETPLSGKCCIGSDTKTQICTLPSCPEWSGWSSWTSCSSSCGVGQHKSTRTCDSTLSGKRCIGTDTKTRVCTLRSCPEWSGWSSWTLCSSSCGVGHQKSTRTCSLADIPLSRSRCIGSDTKTRVCTIRSCPDPHPKDCLEVLNQNKNNVNSVYNVRSPSSGLVYPVYCDMTTDGGGWTVFQKRFDGRLDFYRTFKEYEDGFGDVNAEFWMGLQRIHDMTAHHETELRIHLTAADGSTAFQTFQDFSVSPGPDYKLRVGQSTGTAGDGDYGLAWNNGSRFSTKDKDVDVWSGGDCAEERHGGWWYRDCTEVNLNGDYANSGTESSYHYGWGGVVYYSFKQKQSLKTTTMMFRRK